MSDAEIPKTIAQYEIVRKLAQGGMAEVFLAKQQGYQGFEKLVVIKRILPELANSEDFIRMFLDEARTAADLRHANIVQILEVGQEQGHYHIVMEFLHGQDLRRLLRQQISQGARVPLQHALQIILDAAAGLHYAHQKKDIKGRNLGIVHRDVSPQNIIVTYEGNAKIVDFGIAKAATQTVKTKTGVIKGKYSYMSPEQASVAPLDHRSDQFALGIVAYELILGKRLFKYPNEMMTLHAVIECKITPPVQVLPGFPQALNDILMRALSPQLEDRFADLMAFSQAIEEFMASEGLVHGPGRVGDYMKQLFAETIKQEGFIGQPILPDNEGSQPSQISRARTHQGAPPPTVSSRRNPILSTKNAPQRRPAAEKKNLPKGLLAALIGVPVVALIALLAVFLSKPNTAPLIISSDPPGAQITLDGELYGSPTPAVIAKAEVDRVYVIKVEKNGFLPQQVQVRVLPKQGGVVKVQLKSAQAQFGVVKFSSTPSGAQVYINGAAVQQRTPFDYPRLQVGAELTVSFAKAGYQDLTKKLVVKEGLQRLHVQLKKAH